MKIVEPVIIRPLAAEWDDAKAKIAEKLAEAAAAEAERRAFNQRVADLVKEGREAIRSTEAARRKELAAIERRRVAARAEAGDVLEAYLARLGAFRVLDPACGSGNFLYVALHALMDLERRAIVDAERMGLAVPAARVGLQAVKGIEIEAYAAELARMTLWIGYLQWNRKNAPGELQDPVLSSLDQIENRDALLNADGTEAEWPAVDVIIGNPPFLGGKRMRGNLGDETVNGLWRVFDRRVPHFSDFVCYWFAKSWDAIAAGRAIRAGLVATNSIRGGASRDILDAIVGGGCIFEAWSDEPWILDGAAVRVSVVCFTKASETIKLNGQAVVKINPDLTASAVDLTLSTRLSENVGVCFEGGQKFGPFEVDAELARKWIRSSLNPNERPNSDVLKPFLNAADIVRRSSSRWIIDFNELRDEAAVALYELPFEYAAVHIRTYRASSSDQSDRRYWWLHHRSRPELRVAKSKLKRFITTPVVAKHRLFCWVEEVVWPSNLLDAIARDDDTTFGVLHSRFHELWSLRMGTSLEDRPRYTPSTTFETFPFPEGLTPNIPAADYAADPRAIAIAEAAAELNRLREAWLNPADLVVVVPEVVPTAAPGEEPVKYPDRILPRDEAAAKELKKRTLTNLYNERPTWLDNAHRRLDVAVAAAYGWPADLADEEILERLFALNQERAAQGR
ncbi:MAG: class I SAM-dependent DNA methyltransferase [Rhizobiales bacterium]|nr:class I SAM-dependent DNA methyltransferase [Hyphomicrobiales bacterium]